MQRIRIKFCGIRTLNDVEMAVEAGADAVGFVFFKDSPRYVAPEHVEAIVKDTPPLITTVGIFVNEDLKFIEDCILKCGLNAVQLHGDENAEYCTAFNSLAIRGVKLIKAVRVKDELSLGLIENCPADAILLDAFKPGMYGGTGKTIDTSLAVLAKEYGKRLIVSGGLKPQNVYKVIKEIKPYGVDVSSGIETAPGVKNKELMEEFVKEVRRAELEI